MTREEITRLLQAMVAAYPAAKDKITDARGMVAAWELAFGEEDASRIYKAAKLHMMSSPYFPTISDITKLMVRVGLNVDGSNLIEASSENTSGCSVCVYEDDCDKQRCIFEGKEHI